MSELANKHVPVVDDLELGFQHAQCLAIATASTNGKTTTGEMTQRLLAANHRKAVLCESPSHRVYAVAQQSRGLDFLLLEARAEQLTLSRRVQRAFLLGSPRERTRAPWSLFTPCTVSDSLIEAITEAAKNAGPGDVVLLSPACLSLEKVQSQEHAGESFCRVVKSIGRGAAVLHPNMNG